MSETLVGIVAADCKKLGCVTEILYHCKCCGTVTRTHHRANPSVTGRENILHWAARVEYRKNCIGESHECKAAERS